MENKSLAFHFIGAEQWKTWNMETLPMLPEKLEIQVIPKTGKQYQTVKAQLHRKDIGSIVIATDAGREGELPGNYGKRRRLYPAAGKLCIVLYR